MKAYSILFALTLTSLSTYAFASNLPQIISCGQFKYTDSIRINVDLVKEVFEVKVIQSTRDGDHGKDRFLGSGQIGKTIEKHGDYLHISLFEDSKLIGFLKATPQNSPSRKAYFYYKGQVIGSDDSSFEFLCVYE